MSIAFIPTAITTITSDMIVAITVADVIFTTTNIPVNFKVQLLPPLLLFLLLEQKPLTLLLLLLRPTVLLLLSLL